MSTTVTLEQHGLLRDGAILPLRAGAMHYWRILPMDWGRCLDRYATLSMPIVETYVPWAVHEVSKGVFSFEEPQKNLRSFLDACAERNLPVILRPGPHINAELTDFGIPSRVLQSAACQALNARGAPALCPAPPRSFPIPSYAQEALYQEVALWFQAFAAQIKPYLGTTVVAIQVDNELGYFFRSGLFDLDYSEGSIALYRSFLRTRYAKESSLSAAHGPRVRFDTAEPPRFFEAKTTEDLPKYLDWAAYKRYYLSYALQRFSSLLRDAGITGVPFFHNLPPVDQQSPFSIAAHEDVVDFAGIDLYQRQEEYHSTKQRVLWAAGTSRFPSVLECGLGGWLAWRSFSPEDNISTILNLLMHGIRGLNLYMLIERERWYGSPVQRNGRAQEPLFGQLQRLLSALQSLRFETLTRDVVAALVLPTEYEDLIAVTSAAEPLSPLLLRELLGVEASALCRDNTFGLQHCVQQESTTLRQAWQRALDAEQIPYVRKESALSVERLSSSEVLFVPTFEFLDESLGARLLACAEKGCQVVIGPEVPDMDARLLPGAPFDEVGTKHGEPWLDGLVRRVPHGEGALWLVATPAFLDSARLQEVVRHISAQSSYTRPEKATNAEASFFRDEHKVLRAVFVAAASANETTAVLAGLSCQSLYDPLSQERFGCQDGSCRIPLSAWAIRMLVCE